MQAALTVEGKISNLDVTYAGAYLKRDVDVNSDYSDYSFFYDTLVSRTFRRLTSPTTPATSSILRSTSRARTAITKTSNELRIATPADNRLRFVGGLFAQRQQHDIQQRYMINGLADDGEVTGWDDTFWLTEQLRVDRDTAIYR